MSILDLHPLPMGHDDVKELIQLLSDIYPRSQDADVVLNRVGLRTAEFSSGLPMISVWPQILQVAANRSCIRALVDSVAKSGQADADRYRQLMARLLQPSFQWYQVNDPYDATFIGPGANRSFINRSELRSHLRALVADNSRILIVTGSHGCGKSHTYHMTAHLAWKERTFSPVPIDLSKWSGAPARPVDVMELIRSAMDLPAPPVDELAHPDNQSRVLANWLFSKLRNSGTIWILVFDGLDQPTLTPEALRLIETIAEDSVNKPEIPIRVVLLGYDKNLPGNESMALREQINPIGLPEIRKCLEDTAKHLNVQLEAGAIDRVLQRMLAGLAPEQTLPLADVSKAIVVYAQRLFVSNPSG